jgi:hypothetical protein
MADLLTLDTLARWTQRDVGEVYGDPFAADLIDKVSQLVCFLGGHTGTTFDANGDLIPEWDLVGGQTQAPIDVQMVVLQVCKRSYENPGQVIQEGNIGPIGGDRVADVQALFMDLTESERATVTRYNPDGDPKGTEGAGTIFVLSTTRGEETTMRSPIYVGDDQQIGLAESLDSREWKIPLFNPGDPGAIENYDEL